jgi:hypothetical protein
MLKDERLENLMIASHINLCSNLRRYRRNHMSKLPVVTTETVIVVHDRVVADPEKFLSTFKQRLSEENPILAHTLQGWRLADEEGYRATLTGAAMMYQLLSVQAEADAAKIMKTGGNIVVH